MAPKISVTGFQRSLTRKPKPKVLSAGIEPLIKEKMTALSRSKTPMAAARVNCRKAASLRRSRSSTLARLPAAAVITPRSRIAISATDRLREDSIRTLHWLAASTQTDGRPPPKCVRRAGGWNAGVRQERPAGYRRAQFKVTWSGLPSLPVIDLDHIASISLTTFAGIE